jgi:adenylylsulfate kinase
MGTAGSDGGFAVWLTGPPASGKSTLARALAAALERRGVRPEILESDAVRRVLTPNPRYDDEEREAFYRALAWLAALLARRGVAVIIDATAQRRAWRDRARQEIPRFLEVHVDCPLELRVARDPKGLYRAAAQGATHSLPGLQAPYEAPEAPDLAVRTDQEPAAAAAERISSLIARRGWVLTN